MSNDPFRFMRLFCQTCTVIILQGVAFVSHLEGACRDTEYYAEGERGGREGGRDDGGIDSRDRYGRPLCRLCRSDDASSSSVLRRH